MAAPDTINDIMFAKLVTLGYGTSAAGDLTSMLFAWKVATSVTSWADYVALVFTTNGTAATESWADAEYTYWLGIASGPTTGYLLEDGTSLYLLEDGSSFLLQE